MGVQERKGDEATEIEVGGSYTVDPVCSPLDTG